MSEDKLFPIFFAVWFAVGVGGWLFMRRLNVAEKRKWYPRLSVGFGILFIVAVMAFSVLTNTKWSTPWLAVLTFAVLSSSVAGITWLNIKLTKFCDSCGATLYPNLLQRHEFCSKCGVQII